MGSRKSRITLLVGILSAVACILQVTGLMRYLVRLPDDRVGIALYMVTIVAFALVSIEHFARWRKERKQERGG
jgi:ABC-type transport system involved in cytochrome bd biosynthesis fused ATPase/permease subunit